MSGRGTWASASTGARWILAAASLGTLVDLFVLKESIKLFELLGLGATLRSLVADSLVAERLGPRTGQKRKAFL